MSADLAAIAAHLEAEAQSLGRDLRTWARRDPDRAGAGIRIAANRAVDAIDRALGNLYAIRGQLVSEIRAYDDASDARVDKLLAECRAAREARKEATS